MQTVQYIQPQHAAQLSQAELLVIDEAAAIPLPVVKTLLGPYLVFLCSTVNGYEGTGRSLSLKLIEQLRTEVSVTACILIQTARQVHRNLQFVSSANFGLGNAHSMLASIRSGYDRGQCIANQYQLQGMVNPSPTPEAIPGFVLAA